MTISLAIFDLIITILCEVFMAVFMGITSRLRLTGIIFINVITNLFLSLLLYFNSNPQYNWFFPNVLILIVFEPIIFVIESLLIQYFLKLPAKRAWLLSLALNLFSLILGNLIYWLAGSQFIS